MQDPIFTLIDKEKKRQSEGLELIPSENYVSPAVLSAMGSILTNKYSEGYPYFNGVGYGRKNDPDFKEWSEAEITEQILPNYRYYGGQINIDRIERLAIDRACRLFHADHANVQPHSGAQANNAVYFAWLEPGDTVLGMSLPAGGHLTHGAKVTMSAHIYNFIGYGVTEDGDIDYDELEKLALEHQPKLILVGYSAFMKIPDFARIAKIRDKVAKKANHEILLMADMAHVAGLIAGGVHPNPLDFGFDVMTTTTHKTLRGPRGGLILSNGNVASPLKKPEKTLDNIPILIDRAVFPGTQGGPLEHVIAAKAVTFGEDLKPEFKEYAKNIVANAKALATELKKLGFILQGGGTENHLILLNVKDSFGFDGKTYEKALDMVGLTLNANSLPNDKSAAFRPSGVRLGTPAITTRGLGTEEMKTLAKWMKKVADICKEAGEEENLDKYTAELETIHSEVRELALKFPVPSL
ncbi:serine hydroxymethyltransferase [Candidatus Saccharibacteria bacterium]|nr:serine hydroxymethyltransferase [Candidatus Saccharibacteria bacterium]